MSRIYLSLVLVLFFLILLLSVMGRHGVAAQPQAVTTTVYEDGLTADWVNWSWGGGYNLGQTAVVYAGNAAASIQYTDAWAGFYLHYGGADNTVYHTIRFWIHGGTSGTQTIHLYINNDSDKTVPIALTANSWQEVTVPLSNLGGATAITDLVWQEASGNGGQATFYLDDITLIGEEVNNGDLTLTIDTTAVQYPISPYIYGMNFAAENLAAELDLPVQRWGGNHTSRYNWQLSMTNLGSDWFFENVPQGNGVNPANLPHGSATDKEIEQNIRTGTETLLTVPIMGWTAKRRVEDHPYDCGFSQAKYGSQQSSDIYEPDCGNGVWTNGNFVTGNDKADTSIAIGPTFVTGWMAHLRQKYGEDGVMFYELDNEPMLWHETHRDVHPEPAGYDEVRNKGVTYAAAIRTADPDAQIVGPSLFGWTAYWYSALDAAPGGSWWLNPQDRLAHGNVPFAPWYLQQMAAYEQANGVRLLNYFDLHYYPQAAGVSLSPAGNASTQALRLRSTRALWDPTYEDESWIKDTEGGPAVWLIPRMHEWVDQNYPGTKLAITEYNWGALDHINGALAQADVLGIFGRERLDLATLWDPPTAAEPGAFAFRIYRNYDGQNGRFGDMSVSATSTAQGQLSVYAAERTSDGALTIIVINKTGQALTTTVNLVGLSGPQTAAVYRYSAADLTQIVTAPDLSISGDSVSTTFPASSITLLVIPQEGLTPPPAAYLPWLVKE